jgi:hypothetical protein
MLSPGLNDNGRSWDDRPSLSPLLWEPNILIVAYINYIIAISNYI